MSESNTSDGLKHSKLLLKIEIFEIIGEGFLTYLVTK